MTSLHPSLSFCLPVSLNFQLYRYLDGYLDTQESASAHVWGIQQGVARVQETLCGLTFKIQ